MPENRIHAQGTYYIKKKKKLGKTQVVGYPRSLVHQAISWVGRKREGCRFKPHHLQF